MCMLYMNYYEQIPSESLVRYVTELLVCMHTEISLFWLILLQAMDPDDAHI